MAQLFSNAGVAKSKTIEVKQFDCMLGQNKVAEIRSKTGVVEKVSD